MNFQEFVRRHVMHNLGLKITSLLLATGLWLAIASSPISEVALNVPIVFRNMPNDLEIASENIPAVQVRVRGPERAVRRLQAADVRSEVDLTGITAGERTFDLTRAVGVPHGLEISQVVPSEVHLMFEPRVTRSVPVKPRITGALAPGYRLAIEINPPTVEVTGPKNQVESLESAITDPIDVTGVADRLTVSRSAYVSDPLIQVVNSPVVQLTVTMQKDTTPRQ